MPSKIDEEPIFIGLSTKSEFFADLDEEPRFGDQIKKKSKQSCWHILPTTNKELITKPILIITYLSVREQLSLPTKRLFKKEWNYRGKDGL